METAIKLLKLITLERRWWVIILIFVGYISLLFKNEISELIPKADPIAEQVLVSEKVNVELAKILDYSSADRVYIFQFHNGVEFYDGKHAQRFTCTYEIVKDGISQEADNLVNLQVSVFSWFISQTIDGKMLYTDTQKIENYTTRYSLHSQGIKSIRVLPIIKKNKVIGLIGIDYVRNYNPFLADPIAKEWFEEEARKVSEILEG